MSEWERDGFVSIWVGTLTSDVDLRAYLEEQYEDDDAPISQFAKDCGLGWYDHDFVESRFVDRISIRELLSPFSYAQTFVEAAVEESARKGVAQANSVVVVFNCDYSMPATGQCRLTFLGSFPYSQ
jgi:hypothetical protein